MVTILLLVEQVLQIRLLGEIHVSHLKILIKLFFDSNIDRRAI